MAEDGGRVPMSPGLQATLLRAREYAASQSEAEVLLEHLLLALSEDADAANVLEACQIDLSRLRHDVAGYIGSLDDRVPAGTPGTPAISSALTQVLKYATLAAQQGRRASIDGAIVLAALVGDGRSMAASFLKAQGLTFDAAIQALREVATRSAGAPTRPPAQKPVEPPPPVAPATSSGLAGSIRTENILARARERVENRSPRTEPNGRPQRGDQHETDPIPHRAGDAAAVSPNLSAHPTGEPAMAHARAASLPVPALSQLSGLSPSATAPVASSPALPEPSARPAPTPPVSSSVQSDHEPHLKDGLAARPGADGSGGLQSREAQSTAPVSPPPPLPPQFPKSDASRPGSALHGPPASAALAVRSQSEGPSAAGWWARSTQQDASQAPTAELSASQRASWPEASRAAWPAQSRPSPRPPASNRSASEVNATGAPTIDATMVSHSIPANLKIGRPHVVEVRVERPPLVPVGGPQRSGASRPELSAVRAIAVRLRPQSGVFSVDASSPETLWEQTGAVGADRLSSEAAVWRFTITPHDTGRGILQLSVSARTLGADGFVAETLLPDQAYEVRVSPSIGSLAVRAGAFALVAAAGMLVLKLAEALLRIDTSLLLRQLLGI